VDDHHFCYIKKLKKKIEKKKKKKKNPEKKGAGSLSFGWLYIYSQKGN
jgi:hypothetical protein